MACEEKNEVAKIGTNLNEHFSGIVIRCSVQDINNKRDPKFCFTKSGQMWKNKLELTLAPLESG